MGKIKKTLRLFGVISPIDVLIILAIVALVWVGALFSAPQKAAAQEGDSAVRYTVELAEKEAGFYEKVEIGAALYDSEKGYEIGTIIDAYPLPYQEDTPDEEAGVFRRANVDGLEFTYIVVESPAQVSDYAIYIGEYDLMVNKEVFVKSKQIAGQGYITAIELP